MSEPKCHVCGGVEFSVDAGFYYCSECQTQSQEIREFVFDEFFAGKKAVTRVLKQTPTAEKVAKESEVTLTSWEILNYILKGLVDEIVELGAKPQLKYVTLQLWATYLRHLEVAFLSTSVHHMPRLDINFRSGDAEIVYGVTTKLMKQSDVLLKLRSKSRTTLASSRSSSASSVDSDASISDLDVSRRSYLMRLSAKKDHHVQLGGAILGTTSENLKKTTSVSGQNAKNVKFYKYSEQLELLEEILPGEGAQE